LLVANEYVVNRRPDQCLREADVLLARDPEHARHTLVLQAAHEQIGNPLLVLRHPPSVAKSMAGDRP
jgi:hypothetical protein